MRHKRTRHMFIIDINPILMQLQGLSLGETRRAMRACGYRRRFIRKHAPGVYHRVRIVAQLGRSLLLAGVAQIVQSYKEMG